jgi:hypothetical protein
VRPSKKLLQWSGQGAEDWNNNNKIVETLPSSIEQDLGTIYVIGNEEKGHFPADFQVVAWPCC